MTNDTDAARIAAEIFPSVSNERRLNNQTDLAGRRKEAEHAIERGMQTLRDENDKLKKQTKWLDLQIVSAIQSLTLAKEMLVKNTDYHAAAVVRDAADKIRDAVVPVNKIAEEGGDDAKI